MVDSKAKVYVLACERQGRDISPMHAEQAYDSKDCLWWKLPVHRNIRHHLSLAPLALQLGIVKKTGKRSSLIGGNDEGTIYSLMPVRAAIQTHSLQALHALGWRLNM